jgi:quercetin dioxygenase-like cupin family protein
MNAARILGTAVVALCLATAGPLHAQDKGKDKGKDKAVKSTVVTKVLLENDKVRVTQTTFKPGDVSQSDRKARANYVVKGGTLERTTKDGKKTVYERKTGTSVWLGPDSDVVRNVGKGEYVVVTFTPK